MRKIFIVLMLALTTLLYAQNYNNSPASMTITGVVGQVQRVTLPGDQTVNLTGDTLNGVVELGYIDIFSNVDYSLSVSTNNSFNLNSATSGGGVSYKLKIGEVTVTGNNNIIATGGYSNGSNSGLLLELVFDQLEADSSLPANDYTDTITFTVSNP